MDALMAALVAASLAQAGDRPAWLAAILADRAGAPLVLAMTALAAALAGAIAVTGGIALAAMLTPTAKAMLLAAALALQGAAALGRVTMPDRLAGWRIGAAPTALAGLFIRFWGDGTQFVVLALAVRSPLPWLAAVGATLGTLAAIAPAAVMGEAAWTRLPLTAIRRTGAVPLLLTGCWLALAALRLV